MAGVTGGELRQRIEQIMDGRGAGRLSLRTKLLLACIAGIVVMVPVVAGSGGDARDAGTEPGRGFSPGTRVLIRRELHQYSLLAALHRAATHLPAAGYVIDRLFARVAGDGAIPGPAVAPAQDFKDASFEVASVKSNKSGDGAMQFGMQLTRFTAVNAPLRQLIVFAYGVQPFQIEGGPGWLASERFDITATIPDRFVNRGAGPGETGPVAYMMQKLLAERFKLAIERATKDAPIYELQLARADGRLGPGLKRSTVDCAALIAQARAGEPPPPARPGDAPPCGLIMNAGAVAGGSAPISRLAGALSNRVGRPVVDATGLTGAYDFTLAFAPEFAGGGGLGGAPPAPPPGAPPLPPIDPNAPNIFTALQEQLGLKLDAKRGPVDTIVIKSVEMPSAD